MSDGRHCALRATPAEDLSLGPSRSAPVVTWNGERFGVAWTEPIDGETAVMFVQVDARGHRRGAALRVSERRYAAASPTVAWDGEGWSVIFTGGIGDVGDLYQSRVDERGSAVGRPWRVTRGPRRDLDPVFVSNGPRFGLAWTALDTDGRWSLYAQALRRWDAPEAPAARLLHASVTMGATQLLWNGTFWVASCVTSQQDALWVNVARITAAGVAYGSVTRMTGDRIGGGATANRHSLAWDGAGFGAAWSELRDGRTQVFVQRLDARLKRLGEPTPVRDGAETTDAPALSAIGDGTLALAYQSAVDGVTRVRVRTLGADDQLQHGSVSLQDVDGTSTRPAMVWTGSTLGVATVSPRGVAFHVVGVGPCVE